jgi:L-threonate 2-dehydrogenase
MTALAVIGGGAMGAAVGARLVERGATVLTCLEGRSAATRERAAQAGIRDAGWAELAKTECVLSIVPPGEALAVARHMTKLLHGTDAVYVDCNAVSPQTVQAIADVVAESGAPFVDAGIIGGPPSAGYDGPVFYASGAAAERFAALRDFGLTITVLQGGVGTASGLKMSYGGITKGLTALAAAMMLGASRFGAAEALRAELGHSLKPLMTWFERQVPSMYPKAYRWVAEMEEVSAFLKDDPAASRAYAAIAEFYQHLADDFEGDRTEIGALEEFLKKE